VITVRQLEFNNVTLHIIHQIIQWNCWLCIRVSSLLHRSTPTNGKLL